MRDWSAILIRPENSIVDAIRVIDSGGGQIAIVADEDRHVLGVVTDADVRKALVGGGDLQASCTSVMSSMPIVLNIGSSHADRLDLMRRRHIRQLPLVDDEHRFVELALLMELIAPDNLQNPVVIMAGGPGSRLGHLTHETPKPLLRVGNRPLLETILLQLIDLGFYRFFVSVNYKAEAIMSHFGDGSAWGVDIQYLQERERLGTAGALHLLPQGIDKDIVVMNGDILTKVDVRNMLSHHRAHEAGLTMGVKDYTMTVPYGVVEIDSQTMIKAFREKPDHRFFVNAGIYVLSPAALEHIPADRYFDMPALFQKLREEDVRMSAFPIREYWTDIGLPQDYERANSEYDAYFTPRG